MTTSIAKIVVLVCFHTNPADHFSVFSEDLVKQGYEVQICASELALKKFQEKNIEVKTPFVSNNLSEQEEDLLIERLNKCCDKAFAVVSDVGHKLNIKLHKTLTEKNPEVLRIAYYDNPESPDPFLPFEYSSTAKNIMKAAQVVLFANSHLAFDTTIDLPKQKRIGLGYYPIIQAEKIAKKRVNEQASMRSLFLQECGQKDVEQKIITYFGGNNQEYFEEAFPAFLTFLSEGIEKENLSHLTIVLQQHPGAKNANIDKILLESWISKHADHPNTPHFIVSNKTTEEMQIITDAGFYHQTSMGPLLAISGIPVMQIGNKLYEDVLIKGGLCPSVTTTKQFLEKLPLMQARTVSDEEKRKIFISLGIKENWPDELKKAFEKTL